MDPKQLMSLYRAMVTARRIDKLELELNNRGEAFFHVSGAGHEGTAILAFLLHEDDWLHCHYRDKALMVARGVAPRTFFDGLFCKQASPTRGRQMCARVRRHEAENHESFGTGRQHGAACGGDGDRHQGPDQPPAGAQFDRRRNDAGGGISGSLRGSGSTAIAGPVPDSGQPLGHLHRDARTDVLLTPGRGSRLVLAHADPSHRRAGRGHGLAADETRGPPAPAAPNAGGGRV